MTSCSRVKNLQVKVGGQARSSAGINLDREPGRSARHHGPERLGQEHARAGAGRPSRLRGHRRRGALRRQGPARDGSRRARPRRRVHGVPVPGRDPRREQRLLPQGGAQRHAQAARPRRARRDRLHDARARRRLKLLHIDEAMLQRSVNEGFSGGEKKRNEIFHMAVLEPTLAHPRRDRLGPRHRRAARRRRRRQRAAQRRSARSSSSRTTSGC